MKINDIYESTTAGAIATVAAPMTTQSRNASIYGGKKGGNLLTGKKSKAKYANSISESKMKQVASDLETMQDGNFKQKYGKTKEQIKMLLGDPEAKKTMQEAAFQEGRDGLQQKMTPMQALLGAYSILISFGTQYLDEKGETPEAQKQLLALVQRLQKDKTLIGLDNKKIEANRDAILKHIHQMMTYAIPILQKYLPAAEFAAKRSQINGILTAYNAARQVNEAHLEEDDLIIVPGQGHRLKSGFIPHDQDRTDHEVEMAKSDLFQAAKNAKQVYELIHDVTEDEGLEGWVQEKIIKANDYLNTIREYLEGKQLQSEMTGGVIAGGAGNFEEAAGQKYEMRFKNGKTQRFVAATPEEAKNKAKGLGATSLIKVSRDGMPQGKVAEAQSMGTALKNTLAKAEPGSKLDNSIKSHNRHIKAGLPGTLKNAPTGYHFDNKGYCRLGDK